MYKKSVPSFYTFPNLQKLSIFEEKFEKTEEKILNKNKKSFSIKKTETKLKAFLN